MVMTLDQATDPTPSRRSSSGLVMEIDRSRAFRSAARRTLIVRSLRVLFPVAIATLLGVYALAIARTGGFVTGETLPEIAMRKLLPEDLAMQNPRYEGFNKDGSSYVFTAKTAEQELTKPGVIKLNSITGEVYQPDKTRTDITAVRGVFDNERNLLDLYEDIDVVSESGLKAKLTRATILTQEDLLTSPEPVVIEFPSGSVRSAQMTLRQKAREATFVEDVAVELTPPPEDPAKEKTPEDPAKEAAPKDPAAEPANESGAAAGLFTPSSGPIHIDAHRLDINDGSKVALFTGNVRARQGDANLTTPELEVTYEGEGMLPTAAPKAAQQAAAAATPAGKLRRILAKKPVVMKRANGDVVTSDIADFDAVTETAVLMGEVIMTSGTDRRASSERVEINEVSGTILLAGDVIVTQGGNELRGGRLAIDRQKGTAHLTTPPEAGFGPGRVNARLMREVGAKGAPAKKKAEPSKPKSDDGIGSMASFQTDPSAPINLAADALDVDDMRKVAVFRGDVQATQETFMIRCAELHAHYNGATGLMDAATAGAAPKGDGAASELTRIQAKTDVRVTSTNGQTATGDWADYDAKTNKITMGGNVVLSRGKNMVRGTRLLIDMTTGQSKIDTAPQNTEQSPGGGGWVTSTPAAPAAEGQGRASAVFFPKELKDGDKKGGSSTPAASAGTHPTHPPMPTQAPPQRPAQPPAKKGEDWSNEPNPNDLLDSWAQ